MGRRMGPSESRCGRPATASTTVSISSGMPCLVIEDHSTHGRFFQKGSGHFLAHFLFDNVNPFLNRPDRLSVMTMMPARDLQQIENLQMLMGLGHDPFVAVDHQQNQVDAADTGQHVVDEFFVAGNVNHPGMVAIGQVKRREAEVNGDAALLFFFEAVGLNAGQRLDQLGFTMVNVTGRCQ